MRANFNKTRNNFGMFAFTSAVQGYCQKPIGQLLMGTKCAEKDLQVLNSTLIGQCQETNYLNDVPVEVYKKYLKKYVAFHISNKLSSTTAELPVESLSLYGRAIRYFCPISLSASGDTF
jgi:Alpha 1,4-glycosyltransferase conserved region